MIFNYSFLIFLSLLSINSVFGTGGVLDMQQDFMGPVEQRGRVPNPNVVKRWQTAYQKSRNMNPATPFEMNEQQPMIGPPKPPRAVPRDYDDLMDGTNDGNGLDVNPDDEEDIKCVVEATRPYGTSPKVTLTGIKERFNSLLIGYDVHTEGKRANKASLYGWSGPKTPREDGVAKFSFDLDYVSILPQAGTPLSYCALIFVPPVVPKFDMRSVFGKPAMSMERYFASEEHLVKALKKKSRKVTSCCFIAYPLVSRR